MTQIDAKQAGGASRVFALIRDIRGQHFLLGAGWSMATLRDTHYEERHPGLVFSSCLMFKRKPTVPKQTAADALDDLACAAAFARRREKPRWVMAMAVVIAFIVICSMVLTFVYRSTQIPGFIAIGGVLVLLGSSPWLSISAACPRCKQDVTACLPVHCHRCRQPLVMGHCQTCSADVLGSESADTLPIRYCPGCGAYVNSDLQRYTYAPD